ncbi:MAG: hypothetical protein ACI4PH_09195 [Faecousia sp.]
MENYKEKLKLQNIVLAIACVILAFLCALGFAAEAGLVALSPVAGDSHWQSQWRGFVSGASMGVLILMLFGLVRNLLALKDEKKLKKLYIKENDERTIQVWTSARAAGCQAFLLLGLVAAIAAGYFSVTISLTILACVLFTTVICLCFKLYFYNKF